MCFNFEVSLGTFITSWTISLYLLTKKISVKQKHNVIFLMLLSSIQALDAILWFIKMKKNTVNYVITSFLIPLFLCAQVYYNILICNNFKDPLTIIFLIIGTIYTFIKFNGYSVSLCNNKLTSPIWGNNEIKLWEFFVFSILIFYPNWDWILMINVVLLPIIHFYAGGAYGSLWCAVANLIAFKYLIQYSSIN
jgi:hypothetical protein